MSKSVLLSVHPDWCSLILAGDKTIELRKNAPDIPPPFKVYIYETKAKASEAWIDEDDHMIFRGVGMVIAEFKCDKIVPFSVPYPAYMDQVDQSLLDSACLTYLDAHHYLGHRAGYGWHISELIVYEKLKELGEFKRWNRTEENAPCAHTKWLYEPCETCKECQVKRAPQSWMYVEELKQ